MKRKLKKRWVVLFAIVLFVYVDHLVASRNGKIWLQAFKDDAKAILAGEWGFFVCNKMPSLSQAGEDFRMVDGVSLVLDEAGNYVLTMTDEARSRLRRSGSRQYLSETHEHHGSFDPSPFASNSVTGVYDVQIDENNGGISLDFGNLHRFLCCDYIGMDDNLFFNAPLENADGDDARQRFYYILPKTPINYREVISRYKAKQKESRRKAARGPVPTTADSET